MKRRTALILGAGAAVTAAMTGPLGGRSAAAANANGSTLAPGQRFQFDVTHKTVSPANVAYEWRSQLQLQIIAPHDGGLLTRLAILEAERAPLNDPMAPLMARLRTGFSGKPAVVHVDPTGRPLALFGWRDLVAEAFSNAGIRQREDGEPVTFDLDFSKRVINTMASRSSGLAIAEHVALWSVFNADPAASKPELLAPWGDPLTFEITERETAEATSPSMTLAVDGNDLRTALDALYHRTYLSVGIRRQLDGTLPKDPSIRCEINAELDPETGVVAALSVDRTIDMGPAWPARETIAMTVTRA